MELSTEEKNQLSVIDQYKIDKIDKNIYDHMSMLAIRCLQY